MNKPNGNSLKFVLSAVPPGFFVDSPWLTEQGVGRGSAHGYDRQGWLNRVTRGVYRRPYPHADPSDMHDWKMAVLSAQWIMDYDFHIGGMTALTLAGHNHYVALGRSSNVYVYGNAPNWLTKLPLDAKFQMRRRQLFAGQPIGLDDNDFDPEQKGSPSPWKWPLRRSTPERAILEALNELPDEESFHVIDMIFPGLTMLRPGRLQMLLEACRSVKVKRLFFLFADRHGHKWLAHMERDKIDFGSGPRMIVHGGRYLPKYELVVPAEFAQPSHQVDHDGP
ncbi:MAG: type IV toxin-antitoxin system AbiEi family antitoxin domain-containing protein [Sphingorhabdus sp.]